MRCLPGLECRSCRFGVLGVGEHGASSRLQGSLERFHMGSSLNPKYRTAPLCNYKGSV